METALCDSSVHRLFNGHNGKSELNFEIAMVVSMVTKEK